MRKAEVTLALLILLVPLTSHAWLRIGVRGEAGVGIVDVRGNGADNLFAGTEWGIGGGFELKFKLIGFSPEFLYHRDFDWSRGLRGVKADNNFRMPLTLRFYLPGIFLGAGPELVFGYLPDDPYLMLNLSLGSSLSLGLMQFVFEVPKVSINWWSPDKAYEIKMGFSVWFNVL